MQFILPEDFVEKEKKGIFFVKEDKAPPKEINRTTLRRWINNIIRLESCLLGKVYFNYCSDDFLIVLNKKHLNHSTLTDIISFQYSNSPIDGDIYISLDRVKENALNFGNSTFHELLRLHSHGILHFCGYSDSTKKDKELMRRKEDEYISLYFQ